MPPEFGGVGFGMIKTLKSNGIGVSILRHHPVWQLANLLATFQSADIIKSSHSFVGQILTGKGNLVNPFSVIKFAIKLGFPSINRIPQATQSFHLNHTHF